MSRHEVAAFYLLLLALSWPYLFLTRGGGDAPGRMLPLVMVGPSMCAFAVVYLSRGRAGVRALARRLLLWRAPVRIYALVLLGLPALFMGVAYAVAVVLFPGEAGAPSANVMVTMAVNSVIIFVFAGLGEEFGWRGLALPQLQDRWGPLAASADRKSVV